MRQIEIYPRLTDIFRDVFDDPRLVISPQLTADDVDDWDSLYHIRLMLSVQEAFKIKFSALEIGQLKNVGDLASLIERKST
jgi:acyl carrier protein